MKDQFVPFELNKQLIELGCNPDYVFKEYDEKGFIQPKGLLESHNLSGIPAILYQQAFDYFREKHEVWVTVFPFNLEKSVWEMIFCYKQDNGDCTYSTETVICTYIKAREDCLKELIKIVKNRSNEI